jgi:hypothetical protein
MPAHLDVLPVLTYYFVADLGTHHPTYTSAFPTEGIDEKRGPWYLTSGIVETCLTTRLLAEDGDC